MMNPLVPRDDAVAIQRIRDAAKMVASAIRDPRADTRAVAQQDLQAVVQEANDGGLSWQTIGETLGVRRGAAYQRFRRRTGAQPPGSSLLGGPPPL